MAKATEKITRLKKPRSSCFLCCFAVSRKEKFSEKISSIKPNNKKKEATDLFSWSMLRMKNKNSFAKTAPLDTSDKSTDLSESKIRSSMSSNFKYKWKIQKLFNRTNSTTKATPFREVPTTVKEIIEEVTTKNLHKYFINSSIIFSFSIATNEFTVFFFSSGFRTKQGPEQNNALDHADTSTDATCRKRLSFRRKREASRTGSSQPGSPDVVKPNPKPARTNAAANLSYSVSMPVPTREKRANPLSKARYVQKMTRQNDNVMINKFDPVVGMSIIVVTLIIMLIWGRFCAILCTSAWLYFVPRLRALKDDDEKMKINGDLDLNSEEYKKRVVLEGFLDRDHRAVTSLL